MVNWLNFLPRSSKNGLTPLYSLWLDVEHWNSLSVESIAGEVIRAMPEIKHIFWRSSSLSGVCCFYAKLTREVIRRQSTRSAAINYYNSGEMAYISIGRKLSGWWSMIMIMPASIIKSLSNAQEVWHGNIFNQYQQEMHWVTHPTSYISSCARQYYKI